MVNCGGLARVVALVGAMGALLGCGGGDGGGGDAALDPNGHPRIEHCDERVITTDLDDQGEPVFGLARWCTPGGELYTAVVDGMDEETAYCVVGCCLIQDECFADPIADDPDDPSTLATPPCEHEVCEDRAECQSCARMAEMCIILSCFGEEIGATEAVP